MHVSRRQAEILGLAADGLTDKEVAARLSVSVSTVRTQLERLYRSNHVKNKTEAVAVWSNQLSQLAQ